MTQQHTELFEKFYQEDSTFCCLASGPSLNQDQIDKISEEKKIIVIGVNDNWRWKRRDGSYICDHIYAADVEFWQKYICEMESIDQVKKIPKWIPIKKDYAKKHENMYCVPCKHRDGLGIDDTLHCGSHSGYQAVNLAYKLGAKKIILLGYDMKVGSDGKVHHFGDHPKGLRNTPNKYHVWAEKYKVLANDLQKHGVDIVNCSPETSIKSVRRESLDDVLSTIH